MIEELPELQEYISKYWSSPSKWRSNQGKVEFCLESSYGDQWFPLSNAPQEVERLVKKWVKLGIMR